MPAPKRLALYPPEYRKLLLNASKHGPVHLTLSSADAKRLREDLYAFRTALGGQGVEPKDLELAIIAEGLRFSIRGATRDECTLTIERQRDMGEVIREALA